MNMIIEYFKQLIFCIHEYSIIDTHTSYDIIAVKIMCSKCNKVRLKITGNNKNNNFTWNV